MFYSSSTITVTSNTYLPIAMMADTKSPDELYMVGTFDNLGGIMKPYRVTGNMAWYATFNKLDRINAQVMDDLQYHVMGCGSRLNTAVTTAGVLRISNDGHLQWFYSIADQNSKNVMCYGIAYDDSTTLVYLYLISNSDSLSFGGT